MSKVKIIFLGLFVSCILVQAQDYDWKRVPVDGSRTGCVATSANNVDEALGTIDKRGNYHSPSGEVYSKHSATAKVARVVIDAQPVMASVKKVIAFSEEEMPHGTGEGKLSNWFVGIVMDKVEQLSGRKVDIGICNFGGIRTGMPKGDVMLDDIKSMFPFKNYLVYLEMKGVHLRKVLEDMAATSFQAVCGAEIYVENKTLKSVSIGGRPLDDESTYSVATITFLLHGGDGLRLADDASVLESYDVVISEAVLEYIAALNLEGKSIKGDDRTYVTIR